MSKGHIHAAIIVVLSGLMGCIMGLLSTDFTVFLGALAAGVLGLIAGIMYSPVLVIIIQGKQNRWRAGVLILGAPVAGALVLAAYVGGSQPCLVNVMLCGVAAIAVNALMPGATSSKNVCPYCEYDLRGTDHVRCPECGEYVESSIDCRVVDQADRTDTTGNQRSGA